MVMSKQQKRERAAKVHALGLAASDTLRDVLAELAALGEHKLVAQLRLPTFDWRRAIAGRCNELEVGDVKLLRRPQSDYDAHLLALKRAYAGRVKPPLRVVSVRPGGKPERELPSAS